MKKIVKIILINFLVFFSFIFILFSIAEISTRIYLFFTRGSSEIGIKERTLNLNYQPFTMYGYNWMEKFSNIPGKNNEIRVLLLGGSTGMAYPTNLLEDEMKKKFKKKINVINASYGAYNVSQELVLYALYGKKIDADIVITFDGANDLLESLRGEYEKGTFLLNRKYKKLIEKPYFGPVIWVLQYSQFYNGLNRLSARSKKYIFNEHKNGADNYLEKHENLNRIISSFGAKHIAILQPYLGFKDTKHPREKMFTVYDFRDRIVKDLYLYTDHKMKKLYSDKKKTIYFNSQFLFNTDRLIFSDDVHFFDDLGYRILSKEIAKKAIELN